MRWNWELADWPKFFYDPIQVASVEKEFLLKTGSSFAFLKTIEKEDYKHFVVEILCSEGETSSKIEGEILDRESLQSSIQKHLGLKASLEKNAEKESRMAKLICSAYESFNLSLTHEMLWQWHSLLFEDKGGYRTHEDPMQIVSNRYGAQKVFFEAPPSIRVLQEMETFIGWFNSSKSMGSVLGRAAIAHVYFESIHPFEDGNGRIGRALVEKILSEEIGQPVLIAVSKVLERRKKEYYAALEKCNRTLNVQEWVEFFAEAILQAHQEAMVELSFLMQKSKMLGRLSMELNHRQIKVLLRMFAAGPDGFQGGMSAEKYIAITKAPRATATRDLTDLVEKGALIKTGQLRHRRYFLPVSENLFLIK